MAIFSLIAKLGLDGSTFEGGLKRATSLTNKFRSSVGAQLGAAMSVAAVTAFAAKVAQTADTIGDLSEQLNISTDDVQRLQVLASQTGVSFETMGKAIMKVSQERLKAIEEGGPARDYFKALGFSVAELNHKSLSNIELITKMGQAHVASGKSAHTQAAMMKVLGEEAYKAAGAISKINELGPINLISKDQIDALGQLTDRFDEIQRQTVVSAVPTMTFFADVMERAIADEKDVGLGVQGFMRQLGGRGSIVKALFQEAYASPEEANKRFEALPLSTTGKLGTIDSRRKLADTTMQPKWVQDLIAQSKNQVAEMRAINRNTGKTARAVEGE